MRFAFCLFKYFPYGGLQRGFLRLAEVCVSRGHQVDVYTGSWEGAKSDNLQIYIIPNKGFTNHRRYESFAKRLDKSLNSKHYDAVVGFNKMPGLDLYFASDTCFAAKAMKRSFWYRMSGRCKTLMGLERTVFDTHSKTEIILISESEIQFYKDYYGTDLKRFHLVPPGISADRLSPPNAAEIRDGLRKELDIRPNQNLVLMVGSGYKVKGVDRAIRAISALSQRLKEKTMLIVIGKGRARPYLRLAKKLGVFDRIKFLGEREDVPEFLFSADLLLHPAYRETAGAVLIEAMAAGVPVLVTDVCGYGFHIDKAQAGRLVPSPFQQETLNNMLSVMLDSDKQDQWRLNGKEYVKKTDVFSRHEKAADVIEMVATC